MNTITNVLSQPSPANAAPGIAGSQPLGQDAFLRLLVTQLKNQNPLKPIDNEAFISQLAQFSQLEQSSKLVKLMEQSLAGRESERLLGMVSLIGRQVTVNRGQEGGGAPSSRVTVTGVTLLDGEPKLVADGLLFDAKDVMEIH